MLPDSVNPLWAHCVGGSHSFLGKDDEVPCDELIMTLFE